MSIAERVGVLALATFDKLPQRCKPRIQDDGRREWTPMSAIVMAVDQPGSGLALKCVSLATGTKCLSASQISKCCGLVLHDCHAEVLAFRSLNRWLLNEVKLLIKDSDHVSEVIEFCDTEQIRTATNPCQRAFRIRENVSFYMFTTVAPCGDASMDLLISSSTDQTPWSTETLAADLATGQPLGRGHFSLLGAVRRKPARADAESTMSKSCTDKMALKQFTGLLQFPVDLLLQSSPRTFLKALVVYQDQFDAVGYDRALGPNGRLASSTDVRGTFFEIITLPQEFPKFEYHRVSGAKQKVSNVSAIYIAGSKDISPVQEVLVNGVKQGFKQFEARPSKASAVCRRRMLELALDVQSSLQARGVPIAIFADGVYGHLKTSALRDQRREVKRRVVEKLGNWVSNSAEDDFCIADVESSMKPPT